MSDLHGNDLLDFDQKDMFDGLNEDLLSKEDDEFDALNNETFGAAEEGDWEAEHEELAELTEAERQSFNNMRELSDVLQEDCHEDGDSFVGYKMGQTSNDMKPAVRDLSAGEKEVMDPAIIESKRDFSPNNFNQAYHRMNTNVPQRPMTGLVPDLQRAPPIKDILGNGGVVGTNDPQSLVFRQPLVPMMMQHLSSSTQVMGLPQGSNPAIKLILQHPPPTASNSQSPSQLEMFQDPAILNYSNLPLNSNPVHGGKFPPQMFNRMPPPPMAKNIPANAQSLQDLEKMLLNQVGTKEQQRYANNGSTNSSRSQKLDGSNQMGSRFTGHQTGRRNGYGRSNDHGYGLDELTPGQVRVMGILKRGRRHDDARQRSDSVGTGTGDPRLDLELERRAMEMEETRGNYVQSKRDEYAGLMTPADRQWLINIQLNQLKCENPYKDDYYYTMFNLRKVAGKANERNDGGNSPQLLLPPDRLEDGKEESYELAQFKNTLGKLQCVTVKAPRRIIDVTMSPGDPVDHSGEKQKEAQRYKKLLLDLEDLYSTLLDIEDADKKLLALPNQTEMKNQIHEERQVLVQDLLGSLLVDDKISNYFLVRKGKNLILRSLAFLKENQIQFVFINLLTNFKNISKRDSADEILNKFWNFFHKHVETADFTLVLKYAKCLNNKNEGSGGGDLSYSLSNTFGASVIVTLLKRADVLYSTARENTWKEWTNFVRDLTDCIEVLDALCRPLVKLDMSLKNFDKLNFEETRAKNLKKFQYIVSHGSGNTVIEL